MRKHIMRQKRSNISIRFYILTTVIVLVSISLLTVFFASFFFVKRKLTNRIIDSVNEDSKRICDDIRESGMQEFMSQGKLYYEVEESAKNKDGRIMIVSRDYHILQDKLILPIFLLI